MLNHTHTLKRIGRSLLFAGLSSLGVWSSAANAETRYVFATFLGDDAAKEKLSIYTSSDGLNFKLLSNTGYAGPTGVLRDPTIMKHSDGKYYIAYTVQSWTTDSTTFGIATSSDLTKWTFLTDVPAGIAKTTATWAPEWFRDEDGMHLIVNIRTSSADGFRSYDFKAKSDTLTDWEAPVAMGIGPNNIDTFVVRSGTTLHAFSKNESTKYIEHATASALRGPWTWVGKADWAGWGSGKEGISLFQLDDGKWRMFLDCYSGCGFLYADSANLNDWSKTEKIPGNLAVRHGTVLREELGASATASGTASGTAKPPASTTTSAANSSQPTSSAALASTSSAPATASSSANLPTTASAGSSTAPLVTSSQVINTAVPPTANATSLTSASPPAQTSSSATQATPSSSISASNVPAREAAPEASCACSTPSRARGGSGFGLSGGLLALGALRRALRRRKMHA